MLIQTLKNYQKLMLEFIVILFELIFNSLLFLILREFSSKLEFLLIM